MHYLFKPIGWKGDKEIGRWIREDEPGLIKKSNPLVLGGGISIILGALIGLFTKSETNKSSGIIGGLLAIGGIVAGIIGFLGGPNLNVEETTNEKPQVAVQQNTSITKDGTLTDKGKINNDKDSVTTVIDLPQKDEIQELIDLLNDKSKDVELRKSAIEKLEKSEDKRIVNPLINCLKRKKENPNIRGYAAWALSSRKDPKEIERIQKTLVQVLSDKKNIDKVENDYVKQRVLAALAKVGNKDALGILKILQSNRSETQIAYIDFAVEQIQKRYAE